MRFSLAIAMSIVLPLGVVAQTTQPDTLLTAPDYSAYILTPKAGPAPRINSAKIFGVRPGAPILYKIATTGNRPMQFEALGLPKGVKLDGKTGIITGSVKNNGTFDITLKATNAQGTDTRQLKLVVGEDIALTPPMGWNSWNCWGNSVSQEKVLSSAHAMLDKGLDQYGWTYINIDDGWQGRRGGKWNGIQPNYKFPDIKALADELHANGLKLGVYSSPWVGTYAGHAGSQSDTADGTYPWIEEGWCTDDLKMQKPGDPKRRVRAEYWRHAAYSWAVADAKQWADWGVDYLKYDWKPNDTNSAEEMNNALRSSGRDIVLSLSNTAPYADAMAWHSIATCFRTTGDIRDNWENVKKIGFDGQQMWCTFTSPGHWPDADMLVVGMVGWGPKLHYTLLTPDEQYSHMSLWALIASPLLIGCDMAKLDDFTLNLLCNAEVNDISQDPLGMHAAVFYADSNHRVYVKLLDNGDLAVGLFNICDKPLDIEFEPRDLGLWASDVTVRDVWRQQDVAIVQPGGTHSTHVAPHGCALYRLSPGNDPEKAFNTVHYGARPYVYPKVGN
jgi:alpha-galactosidase